MSCIRILHRFEAQIERARERGAVLALVAVTLFIVLVSGALAVDISALDRQGQSLQNTADAAALAGVAEWVDSGDPVATRTVIEDLIRQNGFALGDEIEVEIDFLDGAALEVDLVDTEPDVFLGGVVGFGSEIGRDASARYEQCEIGCRQELELPPPFQPIHTIGSGDGFVPVSVGDRLYGVNHHSSTMSCVDRVTESQCFSDRPLFHGGRGTADNHYADVVGNRIYYVGWGGGQTVLQCWDTTVEERCGSEISFGFQGHSTMIIAPDNRIFVFTSSRKVFCVEAVTHATCAGYGGGRPTQLAELNSWSSSNNAAYKSYIAQHNGRIYHTLASGGRQHLHCWTRPRTIRAWEARLQRQMAGRTGTGRAGCSLTEMSMVSRSASARSGGTTFAASVSTAWNECPATRASSVRSTTPTPR